jgi:hypothetical protein
MTGPLLVVISNGLAWNPGLGHGLGLVNVGQVAAVLQLPDPFS